MEVAMQKWPYVNFAYLNVEHLWLMPLMDASAPKWENLTVEAVFSPVSENIMFFDHYTKELKSKRSEFDKYLKKLGEDGWKLTLSGNLFDGKTYQFRRYRFRRSIE
jgi:hypothetical protein